MECAHFAISDRMSICRESQAADAGHIHTHSLPRQFQEHAIARWRAAGVNPQTLSDGLANLSFEIVDLPGSAGSNGRVLIDTDAAGYGWFVDATLRYDK
jgi:hypothetical protein